MRVLEAWGNLSKGRKNRRRGKPQPAPAHSLSMSFQLAIPGQVALQQWNTRPNGLDKQARNRRRVSGRSDTLRAA